MQTHSFVVLKITEPGVEGGRWKEDSLDTYFYLRFFITHVTDIAIIKFKPTSI